MLSFDCCPCSLSLRSAVMSLNIGVYAEGTMSPGLIDGSLATQNMVVLCPEASLEDDGAAVQCTYFSKSDIEAQTAANAAAAGATSQSHAGAAFMHTMSAEFDLDEQEWSSDAAPSDYATFVDELLRGQLHDRLWPRRMSGEHSRTAECGADGGSDCCCVL